MLEDRGERLRWRGWGHWSACGGGRWKSAEGVGMKEELSCKGGVGAVGVYESK